MRVGDLDFHLEISGTRNIKQELEEVSDRLQRLAAIANALDGKDVDIEANVDKDGDLDKTLETVRTLDGFEFDADGSSLSRDLQRSLDDVEFDPEVDAASIRSQIKAAVETGDFDADVDASTGTFSSTDVERDASNRFRSTFERGTVAQQLSRLQDEAFALVSLFTRLSTQTQAAILAITGATAAITGAAAAVAALQTAAVAAAAEFGDLGVRQSLARLKTTFVDVGRDFAESFRPLVENVIAPQLTEFSQILRGAIPQLRRFTATLGGVLLESLNNFAAKAVTLGKALEAILTKNPGVLTGGGGSPTGASQEGFAGISDELFEGLPVKAENTVQEIARQIERTRFKFRRGLIPQDELFSQLESLQLKAVDELRKVEQKTDQDVQLLDVFLRRLQDTQEQLDEIEGTSLPTIEPPNNEQEQGAVDKALERFAELRKQRQKGLITQQEALEGQARTLTDALKKLSNQGRGNSREFGLLNSVLAETENRLRRLNSIELSNVGEAEINADTSPVTGVGQAERAPASSVTDFSRDPLERVRDLFRAGVITQLEAARQKVSALEGQIKSALKRGFEPSSKKVGQLRNRLAQARAELQQMTQDSAEVDASFSGFTETLREAVRNADSLGERLGNAVTVFADQLSQGIGQSVGDALFADQGRLNRLRGRRRQIQQNLRQARRAGNVQQIRQLSSELDRVNQKLQQSETLAGRLGQAFRNFGQVAKQALESFVSQVVQAIAKIAALKIISSFLSLGGAPIPSATALPGAGLTSFIPGAASGGFVEEGGLARIHKGETIIPKGGGMAAGQLDAGTASLNGDTIEIPVRMINDGNRIGSRNKGRAGRA
jgi:hypothetical protein